MEKNLMTDGRGEFIKECQKGLDGFCVAGGRKDGRFYAGTVKWDEVIERIAIVLIRGNDLSYTNEFMKWPKEASLEYFEVLVKNMKRYLDECPIKNSHEPSNIRPVDRNATS